MHVSEKYCPWIGKDLRDLMRTRDKLRKAASKTMSHFLMDSYMQVRNKVYSKNIQLKKQYFSNKITACQGNMKESWKAINKLLDERSKSSNISCLKESGTETVHKRNISDTMNSFFCSIGKELADKNDPVPNPLLAGEYKVQKIRPSSTLRLLKLKRSQLHLPN